MSQHTSYALLFRSFLFTIFLQQCIISPSVCTAATETEDTEEVNRILNATAVVQRILAQRKQQSNQLYEVETQLEEEMRRFYKEYDIALQTFRTVDAGLREKVRTLETQIVAEARSHPRASYFPSWGPAFLIMLIFVCGILMYLRRALVLIEAGN